VVLTKRLARKDTHVVSRAFSLVLGTTEPWLAWYKAAFHDLVPSW